ncbi:MAG: hypothetical protein A2X77_03730 [Gammaproteobacteria bacterium GWE2_42_36]|nr:MAG: hypothetical protein A2X77_03730 [Gammaproteobacteria bacterium GWE2_42_36]HCU04810.1 hypothetical protein [Coxiellaceae bacterium]
MRFEKTSHCATAIPDDKRAIPETLKFVQGCSQNSKFGVFCSAQKNKFIINPFLIVFRAKNSKLGFQKAFKHGI